MDRYSLEELERFAKKNTIPDFEFEVKRPDKKVEKKMTELSVEELVAYEIANNYFCGLSLPLWVQDILAKRIIKKTKRKYRNYMETVHYRMMMGKI